jgi:hypothetical protein
MLISAFNAYQLDDMACLMRITVLSRTDHFFGDGLSSSSFLFPPNQRVYVLDLSVLQADRGCAAGAFFCGGVGGRGRLGKKAVTLHGLQISEKKEILRKPTVL